MKLRAIIIDDEYHSIETLRFDLERCAKDKLEVVGSYQGMKEALQNIKALRPDVIFTDIDMPLINGIEGIEMAQLDKVKVVFTTAHQDFALDAIKVGAYDYLLKPIQLKELDQVVTKIYAAAQEVAVQQPIPSRLAVPTAEGIELLEMDSILFVKAESNYTIFYMRGGKQLTLGKTLKYFQERMPVTFVRVHQSYLVNTLHIKKYLRKDGGSLLLEDAHLLPVSKSHKEEVKAILEQLM